MTLRTRPFVAAAILAAGCAPVPGQSPMAPPAAPAWALEDAVTPRADQAVVYVTAMPSNRVVLKADSEAAADQAVASGLARLVCRLPTMDAAILALTGADVEAGLQALRALPGVAYAEREGTSVVGGITQSAVTTVDALGRVEPNDPRFVNQWAYTTIGALDAWGAVALATAQVKPVVTIAILDTGIDQDHEDIDPTHHADDQRGKLFRDVNFTTSDTVDDKYGHGTHVAGIAAALTNNGIGVAGVAGDARLLNVKVIGDGGTGFDSVIAQGIRWAADHGANIINMSFGQPTDSQLMKDAVAYAAGKGVLLVAAAGNEGKEILRYPASYAQVLSVAATTQPKDDSAEHKAKFSNFGGWVDVAAPGERILSTFPNHPNAIKVNDYGYMNGTSMATPMVSGEAALLWSLAGGDAGVVRSRIESSCDTSVEGSGSAWQRGRINLYRALQVH